MYKITDKEIVIGNYKIIRPKFVNRICIIGDTAEGKSVLPSEAMLYSDSIETFYNQTVTTETLMKKSESIKIAIVDDCKIIGSVDTLIDCPKFLIVIKRGIKLAGTPVYCLSNKRNNKINTVGRGEVAQTVNNDSDEVNSLIEIREALTLSQFREKFKPSFKCNKIKVYTEDSKSGLELFKKYFNSDTESLGGIYNLRNKLEKITERDTLILLSLDFISDNPNVVNAFLPIDFKENFCLINTYSAEEIFYYGINVTALKYKQIERYNIMLQFNGVLRNEIQNKDGSYTLCEDLIKFKQFRNRDTFEKIMEEVLYFIIHYSKGKYFFDFYNPENELHKAIQTEINNILSKVMRENSYYKTENFIKELPSV